MIEEATGNKLEEDVPNKLQFTNEHKKDSMVQLMIDKFEWVKVDSPGPDGVHPILAKKVLEIENKRSIVQQAVEQEGLLKAN